jgi:hypothetical protein
MYAKMLGDEGAQRCSLLLFLSTFTSSNMLKMLIIYPYFIEGVQAGRVHARAREPKRHTRQSALPTEMQERRSAFLVSLVSSDARGDAPESICPHGRGLTDDDWAANQENVE